MNKQELLKFLDQYDLCWHRDENVFTIARKTVDDYFKKKGDGK